MGIVLVVFESDYLFKVQELNLFLYTPFVLQAAACCVRRLPDMAGVLFHAVFLSSSSWRDTAVPVVGIADVALQEDIPHRQPL